MAGYAVRDPSPRVSIGAPTVLSKDELIRQNVVGIAGIDTRAVVRHLRTTGSMKAGVFSGRRSPATTNWSGRCAVSPAMLGADLAGR